MEAEMSKGVNEFPSPMIMSTANKRMVVMLSSWALLRFLIIAVYPMEFTVILALLIDKIISMLNKFCLCPPT